MFDKNAIFPFVAVDMEHRSIAVDRDRQVWWVLKLSVRGGCFEEAGLA